MLAMNPSSPGPSVLPAFLSSASQIKPPPPFTPCTLIKEACLCRCSEGSCTHRLHMLTYQSGCSWKQGPGLYPLAEHPATSTILYHHSRPVLLNTMVGDNVAAPNYVLLPPLTQGRLLCPLLLPIRMRTSTDVSAKLGTGRGLPGGCMLTYPPARPDSY